MSHTRKSHGQLSNPQAHSLGITFLCHCDLDLGGNNHNEKFPLTFFTGEENFPTRNGKFHFAPIYIPKLLKHVEVAYSSSEPIFRRKSELRHDINDLMIVSLKDPLGAEFIGPQGCPRSYALPEIKNGHTMLFQYEKHFFFPFVLNNDNTFLYAFESEQTAKNIIKYIRGVDATVSIGGALQSPVYYENILGISISKKVDIRTYKFAPGFKDVDDIRDPNSYEFIRIYDPVTNEEKSIVGT